jgi:uncharacterized membrane protein YdjX (TVP38/TMEM64 family)
VPPVPSSTIRRVLLVIACAALVPLIPFLIVGELPGEQWLQARGRSDFAFGAAGAVLLGSDVLLPIPSSVIGALLGARLGFVTGFAFAFAGLSAGAAVGYALGRLVPHELAGAAPGAAATQCNLALVLLSRPVPVLAEAAAITAGATRLPIWRFAGAAAAGNALYAAALAGNGAALLPHQLAGPGLVLPMALPVVSWLAWRLFKARRPGRRE